MKHLLKVLPLLLLAVLVLGLVACSTEIVDPGDMPDIGTLPASYTVTFCDRHGNTIKTSDVREGEAAVPPSASMIPTVEGYDFVGWDADFSDVKGNLTVTAQYEKSEYTVAFRMPDGTLIEARTFARLETVEAPGTPAVEGKHFVGWTLSDGSAVDPATVKADAELIAAYEVNVYKVTFIDAEGSVTVEVRHGEAAAAPAGRAPAGKRFDAWDTDTSCVVSDMAVRATYITVHTVRFVDHDGTVIDTQIVDEGTDATAPAAPTRIGYTFAGWDKNFTAVGTDITATALYTINTYTVTFLDADGSVLRSLTVEYGGSATAPDLTVPEGKLFKEWQTEDGTVVSDFSFVSADITVKAVFVKAVTVIFYAMDGTTELARFVIPEGTGVAVPPAIPAVDGYRIVGWSADFENVTEDLSVVARYVKVWKVTFVDHDGTVLSDALIDEGTAAAAPADPAGKEGHHFTGWDKTFDNITSDLTVTAQYAINTYRVRFLNWDGTVLLSRTADWNTAVQAPDNVGTREDWTFTGWDKTYDAIVADTDIHAVWTPDFTVISTAEELMALANATSGFYGLTADLDLTGWDAAVTYELTNRVYAVTGGLALPEGVIFTGDGHSITGLTGPLFGYVKGTIKNCTIDGANIKVKGVFGAFAAELSGKLDNCHVKNSTLASGGDYTRIGLFAGEAVTGASFTGCTTDAGSRVTGGRNLTIGGFVARAVGKVTFTDCESNADLSGFTGSDVTVGGFAGKAVIGNFRFENCVSNATIVISQNSVKAAGIVAVMEGSESNYPTTVTIENCTNNGRIVITGNDAIAGGAAAYIYRAGDISIDGFVNKGEIGASGRYAAGVVAYVESGNGKTPCTLTVNRAYNYASVSGQTAGGIVGAMVTPLKPTNVTASENHGTVSGVAFAGGIVGWYEAGNNTGSPLYLTGCISDGAVSATANGAYAGGLVGELCVSKGSAFVAEQCTAGGSVTAANTADAKAAAGGVFGRIITSTVDYMPKVSHTQITAAVSGTWAGGIAGEYCTQDRTEDYGGARKYSVVGYFFNDKFVSAKLSVTDTTVAATVSGDWAAVMVGTANGNGTLTITSTGNTFDVTGSFVTYYSQSFVAGETVTYWKRGASASSTDTGYVLSGEMVAHKDAVYGNEKTVIFTDEDDNEIAKTYVENGGSVTAPADPEKPGFAFLGWSADGGVTVLSKTDVEALTVSADVTYKAVFKALNYNVVFKDGDTVLSETEAAHGTAPTAPSVTAPAGKAFAGWSDGENVYTDLTDYVVKGDVTFTAVWNDLVTVTFVDEAYTSEAGDHVWATVTAGKGGTLTLPATPANAEGLTFVGWKSGETVYTESELAALSIDGDMTFTAVYADVSYTVIFRNSDGSEYASETVGGGAVVARPATDPKKVMPAGVPDCFTFTGWLCDGVAYDFTAPVNANIVLTASYTFNADNTAGVIGISDMAGLKTLEAGKVYILLDDIDMTGWKAINVGDSSTKETTMVELDKVILYGNGHKLVNLTAMLFQYVSCDMDIIGLTVDKPEIKSANSVAAVFINAFRANNLKFEDVHLKEVTIKGKYVGGFVCDAYNNLTFVNCTVTGSFEGVDKSNVSVFVSNSNINPGSNGLASSTGKFTVTVDRCETDVTITAAAGNITSAGGIISNDAKGNLILVVENSTLKTIFKSEGSYSITNRGGVVGYFNQSSRNDTVTMNNCTIVGTYNGNASDLFGAIHSKLSPTPVYTITNTTNNGESADTQ